MKTNKETLILLVDDQIENLQILGNILNINNYKRALATNGVEALEIAEKTIPDLILLDIMMPNMDGFEVCQKLKENPKTKDIPVVFLTAKSQTIDIVKGFKLGGVDYVTKPFKHEELLIRIKTHIQLKQSQDIILRQNEELNKVNHEKDEILSIAAHDLKNPVQVIIGFAKILGENTANLGSDEIKEFAGDIRSSGESMFKIISDLLDINKAEQGNLDLSIDKFNLDELIESIIEKERITGRAKNIKIHFKDEVEEFPIEADAQKVTQILDNLISNAIKFSPFDKSIYIKSQKIKKTDTCEQAYRVSIIDEGPGISEEDQEKLFIKFARLSNRPTNNESSTRLGLSIVKKFVDILHGRVWCESVPGKGSKFTFELPAVFREETGDKTEIEF